MSEEGTGKTTLGKWQSLIFPCSRCTTAGGCLLNIIILALYCVELTSKTKEDLLILFYMENYASSFAFVIIIITYFLICAS